MSDVTTGSIKTNVADESRPTLFLLFFHSAGLVPFLGRSLGVCLCVRASAYRGEQETKQDFRGVKRFLAELRSVPAVGKTGNQCKYPQRTRWPAERSNSSFCPTAANKSNNRKEEEED